MKVFFFDLKVLLRLPYFALWTLGYKKRRTFSHSELLRERSSTTSQYVVLFKNLVLILHCVKSVQIRTRKNSVFGHISRSVTATKLNFIWNQYTTNCYENNETLFPAHWRLYIIIAVIYCYLKRANEKVLKFHMSNSTYFEVSASLFLVLL